MSAGGLIIDVLRAGLRQGAHVQVPLSRAVGEEILRLHDFVRRHGHIRVGVLHIVDVRTLAGAYHQIVAKFIHAPALGVAQEADELSRRLIVAADGTVGALGRNIIVGLHIRNHHIEQTLEVPVPVAVRILQAQEAVVSRRDDRHDHRFLRQALCQQIVHHVLAAADAEPVRFVLVIRRRHVDGLVRLRAVLVVIVGQVHADVPRHILALDDLPGELAGVFVGPGRLVLRPLLQLLVVLLLVVGHIEGVVRSSCDDAVLVVGGGAAGTPDRRVRRVGVPLARAAVAVEPVLVRASCQRQLVIPITGPFALRELRHFALHRAGPHQAGLIISGLGHSRIAVILGVPQGQVAVELHRGHVLIMPADDGAALHLRNGRLLRRLEEEFHRIAGGRIRVDADVRARMQRIVQALHRIGDLRAQHSGFGLRIVAVDPQVQGQIARVAYNHIVRLEGDDVQLQLPFLRKNGVDLLSGNFEVLLAQLHQLALGIEVDAFAGVHDRGDIPAVVDLHCFDYLRRFWFCCKCCRKQAEQHRQSQE